MLALMNNNGRKKGTRKQEPVNMSAALIKINGENIDKTFTRMLSPVEDFMGTLLDNMVSFINRMVEDIQRKLQLLIVKSHC